MLIIFGSKISIKNFGSTILIKCPNCHNSDYANLIRRRWFTLFFIPIFPINCKYYIACNVCSRGSQLYGTDIKKALQLNKITNQYLNGEISEAEMKELKDNQNASIDQIESSWECPKCNNSNKNTSYVCEHCGYKIV